MFKVISTAEASKGQVLYEHKSYVHCKTFADTLNEEGTGWPFDIIDPEGNVIDTYLGY